MKTVTHPLFIVLAAIYFVYYILKRLRIELPEIITSYLADLLSLFLINTVVLWVIRKLKGDNQIELSLLMVIFSIVVFAVFFEFILPEIHSYHRRDYWDVLCYAISAAGFLFWRRKVMMKV